MQSDGNNETNGGGCERRQNGKSRLKAARVANANRRREQGVATRRVRRLNPV